MPGRRGRPYAIIAFRDEEEAALVRLAMDGLVVSATAFPAAELETTGAACLPFTLKVMIR